MLPETGLMHPEKEHFEFLAKGEFMLQRCRSSGAFIYYPRVAEPRTGATDLEWVKASGLGTVYSTTVIRQKPPKTDYNLALIDLAEGPRMMSRVEGLAPQDVKIGLSVRAKIISQEDKPIVVFEPAA
jgi:uncharacterized OB-fold protein